MGRFGKKILALGRSIGLLLPLPLLPHHPHLVAGVAAIVLGEVAQLGASVIKIIAPVNLLGYSSCRGKLATSVLFIHHTHDRRGTCTRDCRKAVLKNYMTRHYPVSYIK